MYVLSTEKKLAVISAFFEGNSLRSVSRMTYVDRAESSAIMPSNYATDRVLPIEVPTSVQFTAILQATCAFPLPGTFRQDYNFHSLDRGFSGGTTGDRSNVSGSQLTSSASL